MRYFVTRDTYPESDTYKDPLSLHRFDWDEEDEKLTTDRWDKEREAWVHDTEVIPFAGLTGADDYEEVSEEEAIMILANWGQKPGPLRRIQTREPRNLSPTNG